MKNKFNDDLDALFQLPLAEFIGARKTLANRLKKEGRPDEAERVKLLAKPSVSAWTVNQLYWQQRDAFDRLIATGQRFRKAQATGKVAEMRDALSARRESLLELSDVATTLLRDAGNNPSLETIRRITTTLEALSALSSPGDGPTPGRLSQDVDPPGFESFASFVPSPTTKPEKPPAVKKPLHTSKKTSPSAQLEKARQARIAVAKVALQNAKKALMAARNKAQSLEAENKKAGAVAKDAERERRQAEMHLKQAAAVAEATSQRARSIATKCDEATHLFEDAKRAVDNATKELEALFREEP